jgi:hypothetical protein
MMQPLRTGQDTIRGESKRKLDEVSLMKKECERTRTVLPDYLRGHVFWTTRNRIERHLEHCVVCKSEFDALRRMEETRQLLKYVDSPGGVAHRVREGISTLTKLKKILYRPLWLAGIALIVAGVYYYAMLPRQLDIEIENIVKTAPVTTSPPSSAALQPKAPVLPMPAAGVPRPAPQPVPTPAVAPLAVSITPVNETTAIQRINEVMQGHEQLRTLKFSETQRGGSGKLIEHELLTFFDRIKDVAKVRYDPRRLKSFPAAQQVPFVLTLKAAPKTVEKTVTELKTVQSTEKGMNAPAETKAPAPVATAPTNSATP